MTAKADGDGVRAESPDVKYEPAKVWLQEGKTLGGSQNFGFVQNLVTSTRGAVYRRGGDPAGDITSEPREGHGKAYDAVSDPNDDTKINKRVFPPFYWPPSSLNDDNVAASPAETDAAAHDQPGFTLPAKKDDGRLTEFTGADQFKLGVAVKKGDAVYTLNAFDWSVPWAMNVDANLNGAGKAVQSTPVQNLLRDGPDTSLGEKDWSLRPNSGDVFEGFSTQAEAMKRSPKELLNWIHKARQYDQLSYQNICGALDAKAPGVDRRHRLRHHARELRQGHPQRQRPARRRSDQQRGRHPAQQRREPHAFAGLGRGVRVRRQPQAGHGAEGRALRDQEQLEGRPRVHVAVQRQLAHADPRRRALHDHRLALARARLDLQQHDRVQHEHDREEDGPSGPGCAPSGSRRWHRRFPPTPNAPDIPASFPEWRRIRRIRITAMKTCRTESTV